MDTKPPLDMDEIYRKLPPEQIPWNVEEPPDALVSLLDDDSATVWERVRVRLEAEGRAAEPALRVASRSTFFATRKIQ